MERESGEGKEGETVRRDKMRKLNTMGNTPTYETENTRMFR